MTFVIDASAMLCWCFADERPANHGALLKKLLQGGMIAPGHWPLELTNIMRIGQRKGRITPEDAAAFLAMVLSLDVEIDAETADRSWNDTRELADAEGLTTYDAVYLELAIRQGGTLVSKDADLLKAARRMKVAVLDVSV